MASEVTGGTQRNDTVKDKLQRQLEEVKQRLTKVQQEIGQLQAKDEEAIRRKADEVKQRMAENRDKAKQMREDADSWLKEKKQHTEDTIASWRKRREMKQLEKRADRAEEYAANAIIAAMMDADEAESAVLDALCARFDADNAATAQP